jgi:hypothetical protein
MNKRHVLAVLFTFGIVLGAYAQEQTDQPLNSINVNLVHPLIMYAASVGLSDFTAYLSLHGEYAHAFSRNWGMAGQFIYRLEMDGDYFRTNEFGIAVGPRFSLNYAKSLFVEIKAGIGYTFGIDYNDNPYSRLDLIIAPDVGYTFVFWKVLSLTLGIGLQTLIPVMESPQRSVSPGGHWDWNEIGWISHYFLPVVNVSVGVVF